MIRCTRGEPFDKLGTAPVEVGLHMPVDRLRAHGRVLVPFDRLRAHGWVLVPFDRLRAHGWVLVPFDRLRARYPYAG